MCGIFGYVGSKNATKICLEGLKQLEYRGYDSAGIAGIDAGKILLCKAVGNISKLEEALHTFPEVLSMAISHTRWATHGKPSMENAHPQLDHASSVATVHNGVIENYAALRSSFKDTVFHSETDTEVIAQLVASKYKGDFLKSIVEALSLLEGSFAVAIVHKDHPDQIIAAAQHSPLVVATNAVQEHFITSDPNALFEKDLSLYYLGEGEIAFLQKKRPLQFFDRTGKAIVKEAQKHELFSQKFSKEKFPHFMLKEIFEQGKTVRLAMKGRLDGFEDLSWVKGTEQILIIGCGTSYHAACLAGYYFEAIARIPTRVEIASEYRYKPPLIAPNTLIIALSQSGETADTLACTRMLSKHRILSLCNVEGSTLARESFATLFLHAGPEIAVASTKTFTSQVTILYLLSLFLSDQPRRLFIKKLYEIPEQIEEILSRSHELEQLAKKYAHFNDFYFLGRGPLFPTALESALKLKEIAYIDATGYPAGEMKHGPIALLSKELPVVVFTANRFLHRKIESNLMESKARGAPIIAFGWKSLTPPVDDLFLIPETSDELAPILLTVATQLFAYYIALARGCEIDQPRNLAKSVTVE